MICSNCGAGNSGLFCTNCGNSLIAAPSTTNQLREQEIDESIGLRQRKKRKPFFASFLIVLFVLSLLATGGAYLYFSSSMETANQALVAVEAEVDAAERDVRTQENNLEAAQSEYDEASNAWLTRLLCDLSGLDTLFCTLYYGSSLTLESENDAALARLGVAESRLADANSKLAKSESNLDAARTDLKVVEDNRTISLWAGGAASFLFLFIRILTYRRAG